MSRAESGIPVGAYRRRVARDAIRRRTAARIRAGDSLRHPVGDGPGTARSAASGT